MKPGSRPVFWLWSSQPLHNNSSGGTSRILGLPRIAGDSLAREEVVEIRLEEWVWICHKKVGFPSGRQADVQRQKTEEISACSKAHRGNVATRSESGKVGWASRARLGPHHTMHRSWDFSLWRTWSRNMKWLNFRKIWIPLKFRGC